MLGTTYLAIFQLKDELGFGPVDRLADELGGYPTFGSVRLPCSCANIVGRCHGGTAGEVVGNRRRGFGKKKKTTVRSHS
jgi:hypothetical protein